MSYLDLEKFDYSQLETPAFVLDTDAIRSNCEILESIERRVNCKVLFAIKAFAMHKLFPIIGEYISGTTASGIYEARLGHTELGGEVHVFSPAFTEKEIEQLLPIADHIIFNSFSQWQRFKPIITKSKRKIKVGLRINPEYSEIEIEIYNPCAKYSRLGIKKSEFAGQSLEGISGLHFHNHCEQNAAALEHTLIAVSEKFADILPQMEWVNFGGGHNITQKGYNIELLNSLISNFKEQNKLETIYLEPGETFVLNSGVLVASVIDIVYNEIDIAILDVSATAHMPDVLEMPYRPDIVGANLAKVSPYTYRLTGPTCLAGDIIGDYSFEKALRPGDKIIFLDMAHYTMVKTTMFNGVRHPSIAIHNDNTIQVVKRFHYDDYKNRMG